MVIIKNLAKLAKPRNVVKEVKYIISLSERNHQPFALIATQHGQAAPGVFFFTTTDDYIISSITREIRIKMKVICSVKCASLQRSGANYSEFQLSSNLGRIILRVPTVLSLNRLLRTYNSLPILDLDQTFHTIKAKLHKLFWQHFSFNFDINDAHSFHFVCPCISCSKSLRPQNFTSNNY